jgi:hypothetical protein
MSTERETTRIVRSWLLVDEHESADRVLDMVLDQLDTTPQRRATWWPARRTSTMSSALKIGLAAVVVALAALIGINYFGTSNVGGPGIDSSTSTAQPSPSSTPPTPSSTPVGLLPEGPHSLATEEEVDGQLGIPITVTIPAPNWYGEPGSGVLQKNDHTNAPDGAGMIGPYVGDLFVYGDPCRWATTRPDAPATTVDELVTALAAQASRDASEPVDITVDGYAGKSITLHVPDDAVFSECDRGIFGSWGVSGSDISPFRYHQGPGQIDVVWALDLDGVLAVIDWSYYEGTPPEVGDELRAIVDSIRFE